MEPGCLVWVEGAKENEWMCGRGGAQEASVTASAVVFFLLWRHVPADEDPTLMTYLSRF